MLSWVSQEYKLSSYVSKNFAQNQYGFLVLIVVVHALYFIQSFVFLLMYLFMYTPPCSRNDLRGCKALELRTYLSSVLMVRAFYVLLDRAIEH